MNKQQILEAIPSDFSEEAREVILEMVVAGTPHLPESMSIKDFIKECCEKFEEDYPALAVCPRCKGEGCSYCDFDGVYDPDEVEPDGTN